MTDLGEILKLVTDVGALLNNLKQSVSAPADAQDKLQGLASRAQQFANALGQPFTASPRDRTTALDAEIKVVEAARDSETNPIQKAILSRHLANLQVAQGDAQLTTALSQVVVFSDEEVTTIESLLTQAQHDIVARKDLASFIQIGTAILTAAAQIGGKVATAGVAGVL
jgi:hypothetical protein